MDVPVRSDANRVLLRRGVNHPELVCLNSHQPVHLSLLVRQSSNTFIFNSRKLTNRRTALEAYKSFHQHNSQNRTELQDHR